MKSLLSRVGLVLSVSVLAASVAFASPGKKSAAPKCSACKMELSAKKDKAHPTAVKIGKKTYYCCSDCAMGKKKK